MGGLIPFLVLPFLAATAIMVTSRQLWIYAVILFSGLPIRFFTDTTLNLPALGEMNLDSLMAIFILVIVLLRYLYLRSKRDFGTAFSLRNVSLIPIFYLTLVLSTAIMVLLGELSAIKVLIRWTYPIAILLLLRFDLFIHSSVQKEKVVHFILFSGLLYTAGVLVLFAFGGEVFRFSGFGVMRFAGLGSIADYAYLMGFLAVISYSLFRVKRSKTYLFLSILFFTQVLLTITRGAILSTTLAILAVEFLGLRSRPSARVLLVSALMITGFVVVSYYEPLRQRVFGGAASLVKDASLATRLFESSGRQESVEYTLQNLEGTRILYGWGAGSSEKRGLQDVGQLPHNEYINILFDLGLFGLSIFILMFIQLIRIARRGVMQARSNIERVTSAAMVGILTVYILGSMVDNMANKYKLTLTFLMIFSAFCLSGTRKTADAQPARDK